MKNSLFLILVSLLLNGCGIKDFFTLGENKTVMLIRDNFLFLHLD